MVGTGRFELPTPRTPSECSTRLSHVPTVFARRWRAGGVPQFYMKRHLEAKRLEWSRFDPDNKGVILDTRGYCDGGTYSCGFSEPSPKK